jgi:hypothetical protein
MVKLAENPGYPENATSNPSVDSNSDPWRSTGLAMSSGDILLV